MEDSRPLERCSYEIESELYPILPHQHMVLTMLGLAGGAVTQLGVQGHLSAKLVLYFSAVTAGFISSFEIAVGLVDAIRRLLLPILHCLG